MEEEESDGRNNMEKRMRKNRQKKGEGKIVKERWRKMEKKAKMRRAKKRY